MISLKRGSTVSLTKVGSRGEAREALTHYLAYTKGGDIPKDWETLNGGSYRAALKSPTGTVYKVQRSLGDYGRQNQQVREVFTLQVLRREGYKWATPATLYHFNIKKTRRWNDPADEHTVYIVAMPYVHRTEENLSIFPYSIGSLVWDADTGGNVKRNKGRYFLIDAGNGPTPLGCKTYPILEKVSSDIYS